MLAYIAAVIRLVYPQAELSTIRFRPGTAFVALGFVLQEVGLCYYFSFSHDLQVFL